MIFLNINQIVESTFVSVPHNTAVILTLDLEYHNSIIYFKII